MAGMGKRMRPHTLTIPKPLINIAGKSIVQRLVEDLGALCKENIDEIGFIVGDFGDDVEQNLLQIAKNIGAKGKIYYQNEALGTAHAVLCAQESLKGNVIVAFADTLFKADFVFDRNSESIIWVHKVEDPKLFGVVKTDTNNYITDFVEKPKDFVSDLAIIGIYYFKDGEKLKSECQFLIDNNIIKSKEYQLTDALINMMNKGTKFSIGKVNEWLDCGNKDATVYTNKRILEFKVDAKQTAKTAIIDNSVIIQPCYIGENVKIDNSVIGPHVSIGNGSVIDFSIITNSIIQNDTKISCVNIDNSMIGSNVEYVGENNEVSIGDFTSIS